MRWVCKQTHRLTYKPYHYENLKSIIHALIILSNKRPDVYRGVKANSFAD